MLPGLKYYTFKELFFRLLWNTIGFFLFKYTPRHLYLLRNLILRIFGARVGVNSKIFPSVRITHPWLLEIGSNCVISWNVTIYNLAPIVIGSHVVISQNVHLCGGTHDYLSAGFELQRCEIKIGSNVWIAADAFIGPNVTIGDNSIIAARGVCIKDIGSGIIVGGNPAKFIRNVKKPIVNSDSIS
jgi:putative colanic acid biosynthesis acetyltransferase WcaF